MKRIATAVVVVAALAFTSGIAMAQERLGDGAMGAVAGAVVGGPIGAVAGGLVGYTAGPSIAHSWGLHHHYRHHRHYASH